MSRTMKAAISGGAFMTLLLVGKGLNFWGQLALLLLFLFTLDMKKEEN